jgi:hypothetical protein
LKRSGDVFFDETKSLITGPAENRSSGRRIPAANLEALVLDRLGAILTDVREVLDLVEDRLPNGVSQSQAIDRVVHIAEELKHTPAEDHDADHPAELR